MPKDYVTPNVSDDLQQRLQSITQQILSRTRLLHIIDDLHLYADGSRRLTPDEKVERMRKEIEIELARDPENRVNSFNVYYSARDPYVAQQVTHELTNLFISENLEVRQQQSENTTQFLESQLETARTSLTEQEDKIRTFKGQHVGELPAQLESNLQILSGLQNQLQDGARGTQHCQAAARLPANIGGSVPRAAGIIQSTGWCSDRSAGSRPGTGAAEGSTRRPEFPLHRSPPGCSQSARPDRQD